METNHCFPVARCWCGGVVKMRAGRMERVGRAGEWVCVCVRGWGGWVVER